MNRHKYLVLLLIFIPLKGFGQYNEKIIAKNKESSIYYINDTIRYSDIDIIYDVRNIDNFSSLDSKYSKYYNNGIETIKVSLDSTERKIIFEVVKNNDFFSLPSLIEEGSDDDEYQCVIPSFTREITIIIRGNRKSVSYGASCPIKDKNIESRYFNISKVITGIIYNKKEIREMKKSDQIFE